MHVGLKAADSGVTFQLLMFGIEIAVENLFIP